MNRNEFINELRKSLSGKINPSEIDNYAQYYDEYIDKEYRNGKSEEEILDKLGSPLLHAKSIVEASSSGENHSIPFSSEMENKQSYKQGSSMFRISGWLLIVIVLLIIFAVLGLAFSALAIILKFFLPIILILIVIKLIVFLFNRN